MLDAYIGGRSENNVKCVVVHNDLWQKNRTTLYNCRFSAASLALQVILSVSLLGTTIRYSVLSRSPSVAQWGAVNQWYLHNGMLWFSFIKTVLTTILRKVTKLKLYTYRNDYVNFGVKLKWKIVKTELRKFFCMQNFNTWLLQAHVHITGNASLSEVLFSSDLLSYHLTNTGQTDFACTQLTWI